jgi:hypothetical protein
LEEGKGVHRYALVDKDTLRGIAGRYQQTGDTSSGTDSLGDVKKDITVMKSFKSTKRYIIKNKLRA